MRYLVRKLLKNNLIIIAVISKLNVLKIGYFFKFFFEIYFKNFIILMYIAPPVNVFKFYH